MQGSNNGGAQANKRAHRPASQDVGKDQLKFKNG